MRWSCVLYDKCVGRALSRIFTSTSLYCDRYRQCSNQTQRATSQKVTSTPSSHFSYLPPTRPAVDSSAMADPTTATATAAATTCVVYPHELRALVPHDCAVFLTVETGERLELPPALQRHQLHPSLQFQLEPYRRWNTTPALGFLHSIDRVDISGTTRANKDDDGEQFTLAVHLRPPRSRLPTSPCNAKADARHSHRTRHKDQLTYTVERAFAEFQALRTHVLQTVCTLPQCTCAYCLDFVLYIRFKYSQPRRLATLLSGNEQRRQMLARWIDDLVSMGQRRAPTSGRRKCQAQRRVPAILQAFLLNTKAVCVASTR